MNPLAIQDTNFCRTVSVLEQKSLANSTLADQGCLPVKRNGKTGKWFHLPNLTQKRGTVQIFFVFCLFYFLTQIEVMLDTSMMPSPKANPPCFKITQDEKPLLFLCNCIRTACRVSHSYAGSEREKCAISESRFH